MWRVLATTKAPRSLGWMAGTKYADILEFQSLSLASLPLETSMDIIIRSKVLGRYEAALAKASLTIPQSWGSGRAESSVQGEGLGIISVYRYQTLRVSL